MTVGFTYRCYFIPFAVMEALSKSRVMTSTKPTPMIINGNQVVYLGLAIFPFQQLWR